MASITGPRGGSYRARYRTPDGKSRSRTFERKADAEAFLVTIEADKVRGNWTDPAREEEHRGMVRNVACQQSRSPPFEPSAT